MELAQRVKSAHGDKPNPSKTILEILKGQSQQPIHHLLHHLLDDVYSITSFTTQIFQQHTLGSQQFRQVYDIESTIERESYLLTYDQVQLSEQNKQKLIKANNSDEYGVVIYTARPSRPPIDISTARLGQLDRTKYPPEGDFAWELMGVQSHFPMIAGGRMAWLAEQMDRHVSEFIKPSPVQALSAIISATSGYETNALRSALAFFENGMIDGPLNHLREKEVKIVVFEDSTGGIKASPKCCKPSCTKRILYCC